MTALKHIWRQGCAVITTLLTQSFVLADGIIPISSDDQTQTGTDFATTLMHFIQKGLVPLVMVLAALWIIWTGISTMANGIKEAQDKQKFDPLKNAIIKTVIVVVIGGALIYLLTLVQQYKPA